MYMRVFTSFVVLLFLCVGNGEIGMAQTLTSTSAPTPSIGEQWQERLQAEMLKIQARTPSMTISGEVIVQKDGDMWVATLPVMTVTVSPDVRFTMHAMTLSTHDLMASTAQVNVTLPKMIPYHDRNGIERGYIKIATQNIAGHWDFSRNHFENLAGTLDNVVYYDRVAHRQSSIEQIMLDVMDPVRPKLVAHKIQNITQSQGAVLRSLVRNATLQYELTKDTPLTLGRLVGLLNPVWLLSENEDFSVRLSAQQVSYTNRLAQMTSLQQMNAHLRVLPQQDKSILGGKMHLQMGAVTQQPESSYSFILPQKLELSGHLRDMPVQILNQPFNLVQDMMAEMGTYLDIDEMVWDTPYQARLQGSGWLRAAANVPMGAVGRFTLHIDDLRVLSASLQKQLSIPGGNLKAKAQGYMLLMLLQSFAKSDGTASEIILDFTEDGQVLVNNRDISGLLGQASRFRR